MTTRPQFLFQAKVQFYWAADVVESSHETLGLILDRNIVGPIICSE